jgi:hypothetical protein
VSLSIASKRNKLPFCHPEITIRWVRNRCCL